MKKSLFIVLFIQLIEFFNNITSSPINNTTNNNEKPILFIISYDGFRNEYLKRNVTKNLLDFRQNGVYADYMLNVFPTKTFTNHHSIATGYYPDKHGVLANSVYDSEQGFLNYKNNGYKLFHYNPDILPIWIVNQQYNGTSGCMMWPGSEFEYGNKTCQYVEKYDSKISLKDRVDTVISWLTNNDNPPNLIMFYSEQPDKLAHMVGPDSSNVTDMIKELDLLTKYIQDKLTEINLINRTNVIHLSDHGMTGVKPPKFINLTQYLLEPNSVKFYGTSPILQIVPENMTNLNNILNHLKLMSEENGNFKIYTNNDILSRWHCKNIRRLGPILAVANDGYAFQDMWQAANSYLISYNITFNDNSTYGVHGYDNENDLMHSYFMAKGPLLKSSSKVEPFESVDLFSLFIHLLQINIQNDENHLRNGKFERVQYLLENYSQYLNWTKILVAVCLCAIIVAVVIIYIVHQYRRRQNYTVSC